MDEKGNEIYDELMEEVPEIMCMVSKKEIQAIRDSQKPELNKWVEDGAAL